MSVPEEQPSVAVLSPGESLFKHGFFMTWVTKVKSLLRKDKDLKRKSVAHLEGSPKDRRIPKRT